MVPVLCPLVLACPVLPALAASMLNASFLFLSSVDVPPSFPYYGCGRIRALELGMGEEGRGVRVRPNPEDEPPLNYTAHLHICTSAPHYHYRPRRPPPRPSATPSTTPSFHLHTNTLTQLSTSFSIFRPDSCHPPIPDMCEPPAVTVAVRFLQHQSIQALPPPSSRDIYSFVSTPSTTFKTAPHTISEKPHHAEP